jgi:hypothetical protein
MLIIKSFFADESGPAAMQHGTGSPRVSKSPLATIFCGIFVCLTLNAFVTSVGMQRSQVGSASAKKNAKNRNRQMALFTAPGPIL